MGTLRFGERAARRLEAIYSTSDIVAQRAETLRLLALTPGDSVIDVGCGPGFLCESMGEAVGPTGSVLGIDLSADLLDFASSRNASDRLSYQQGDATALDLAPNSFDVAVSVQVFEYVKDVERAIGEVFRVLKPGGRVVIGDTDWDAVVWHSADLARMRHVLRIWQAHCAEPHLPRTLVPKLRAAGFRVDSVHAFPIINTALHDDTYSLGMIEVIAEFVKRQKIISPQMADDWAAELHALGESGQYFFSTIRYFFKARKPGR